MFLKSSRWRQAAKAVKKAILGNGRLVLLGRTFRVVYESRRAWIEADHSVLKRLAQGRSCVYDVGAYIGITTLIMGSEIHPLGKLVAFEPSSQASEIVRDNVALNNMSDRVMVVNAFVGSQSGRLIEFYESGPSVYNSSIPSREVGPTGLKPTLKPSITLDDFADYSRTHPDFIKIDVEGAERDVLAGMTRILREDRPLIFLELHKLPNLDLVDHAKVIHDLVSEMNYSLHSLKTRSLLDPTTFDATQTRGHILLLPRGAVFPACLALDSRVNTS
jgi:FkbM family methyltransferase